MKLNKPLLESFMKRFGDTQKDLADALGISLSCVNAKINGNSDFRQNEIGFIKTRYHLSADEVNSIFFLALKYPNKIPNSEQNANT